MKNLRKIGKQTFAVCLAIVILLTVCILPVNAKEAPSSFTVKRTKVMESYIGDNNGFTAYATTDGTIVYCMDLAKKGATTGTKYTLSKEASAGLMYIVKNGYPNKKITNRDEIDQYITQSAVWWYLDETSGAGNLSTAFQTTDKEAYAGIRDEIKKLVNNAKSASAAAKASINVSLNNKSLKLTSDNKYYESDYVNVSLTGAEQYKLVLSDKNASAIDENGVAKTTFKSGEKFKIRILAKSVKEPTTLNVTVNATGSTEYASIFTPSDSNFQRVVSTKIYTKNVNLTDTLALNVTPSKKICTIENGKYYGISGEEVDKKTYNKECGKVCTIENGKYYGIDGKEVDKDTYTKECGKVCIMENGKYYGKNGNEVDKDTYDKECSSEVIAVPNTLANQSALALAIGLMFIVGGLGLIIYRYRVIKM